MSRIADALEKSGRVPPGSGATPPSELNTMDVFAAGKTAPPPASAAVPRAAVAAPVGRDRPALWTVREHEQCVLHPAVDPVLAQQFRKAASTLHQHQRERSLRTVLVTSAVPGEGKTLTAANLALTLSESFRRRVLLIDADLRKPALATFFGVDGARGLSSVLCRTDPTAPLIAITERLSLLPGGRAEADPVGDLTSPRMAELFRDAAEAFDWVILDTPPAAILPDAALLSAMVDGVLFVLRASSTVASTVQRAIDAITVERIIGVILNRAEQTSLSDYGYYRQYGTKFGHELDSATDPATADAASRS